MNAGKWAEKNRPPSVPWDEKTDEQKREYDEFSRGYARRVMMDEWRKRLLLVLFWVVFLAAIVGAVVLTQNLTNNQPPQCTPAVQAQGDC
jgi:cytoskeletal protein RodZ